MNCKLTLKSLFASQDLTTGSPITGLLRFSFPLLLGNIVQQLYSTADSIIVGKFVGDTALAAVGATFPVIFLLLVLFMAIATGTGILVSQFFGARSWKMLNQTIGNALLLVFASSIALMAIAIPLARPLLSLLGTPGEIISMSTSYMQIVFIGILGFGFYNIIAGVLRGLGDSVTPLIFLVFATFLNVCLDLVFIAGLGWGVAGAAWATITSQILSAALCLVRLLHMRDVVTINKACLKIDRKLVAKLLGIGMPAGITQAVFSLSMLLVQALANSMGYQVITTTTAVMRIDGFAMLPNFTFGMAITTFVGQNIGAKKMDRVEQGIRTAIIMGLVVSSCLTLLLLIFGGPMIGLFTETPEIINLGMRQIRILAAGYIAMALMQIFGGIMRGAGDTMPSMWISMLTTAFIRVPSAYILAHLTRSTKWPNGSPDSLFFSLLATWVLGAFFTYAWYRRGKWRKISLIESLDTPAA